MKEDVVVYYNEDYIVFKKYGTVTGYLTTGLDLVDIGIDGLKDSMNIFRDRPDKLIILAQLIERIEAIKKEI